MAPRVRHAYVSAIPDAGDPSIVQPTDWNADHTLLGVQGTLTLTTTGTSGPATLIADTLNIPQYSGSGGITELTGDVTAGPGSGSVAALVVAVNGVNFAGLGTGILKNTTGTGQPSIAVAGDFPTLNQNTTGSAAKWTTARALAGNSVDGSADVPFANKFLVQGTADSGLSGAQFMGALGTGLVKNTTTTGVQSIAAAGTDYQAPVTLTTTGTSGAATFIANVLNVPQYASAASAVTAVSVASANGLAGSSSGGTTPQLTLSTTITGILKGNATAISAAVAGTDYEVPLTFSTGLTRSTNTVTVNTSQNIAKLTNLTTNGIVTTSAGDGTLGVTAPGTGVLTALAVNVGTAGAFVVNGGALGTPSSGTLTNATGLPIVGGTTGTLTETRGGTNQTTYATGDLLYASGANTLSKRTVGSTNDVLTVIGGVPTWQAPSAGSGTVTSVATGTGLTGGPITTTGTVDFAVAAVGTWAATPSSANLAAAMTDETGSGLLVFATSPSLTTPAIGAATGASLILTGTSATIIAAGRQGSTTPAFSVDASAGTSVTGVKITAAAAAGRAALAVTSSGTDEGLSIDAKGAGTVRLGATSTGAVEFSRAAQPTANDGVALGVSGTAWSDLFLASGGVINFNAGNYTITHSAGLLTTNGNLSLTTTGVLTTGTIELGAASDTTLARSSAGNMSIEGNVVYRAGGTDVAVADGGTGLSTLTANNVILGAGTSTPTFVAPGTSGNVLTSNGTTWQSGTPPGYALLGTITTTSGSSQSLTSLTLTGYVSLHLVVNGVSSSGATATFTVGSATVTGSIISAANNWKGWVDVDLATGIAAGTILLSSGTVTGTVGGSGLSTASTSVTVGVSAGNFDAGSVVVYGVS